MLELLPERAKSVAPGVASMEIRKWGQANVTEDGGGCGPASLLVSAFWAFGVVGLGSQGKGRATSKQQRVEGAVGCRVS
jgi:hypothetical protein